MDQDTSEKKAKKSPIPCDPSVFQQSSKRQCLISEESQKYHPPLYDEVDDSSADEKRATIHVLNNDLIDIILSYFNIFETFKLSLVCKRWYNLSLLKIARITTLSLPDIDKLNATNLSHLNDLMPNLVHITLGGSFLTDFAILEVISEKIAPRMKSICLDGYSHATKNEVLSKVLKNVNKLAEFSLYQPRAGPTSDHEEDASIIPSVLSLTNPVRRVRLSCPVLHPSVLEFFIGNFADTLEHLDISICDGRCLDNIANMKNLPMLYNMKTLYAQSRNVTNMSYPPPVSCSAMILILMRMPNLKNLDLTGNYTLSSKGFDVLCTLSTHCLFIEELNLSNCYFPAEKLDYLKKLKCLKKFRYDQMPARIYSQSLLASTFLIFASNVLPHLKKIEYVSMRYIKFEEDELVLFIGNAGPKFKELVLKATNIMCPIKGLDNSDNSKAAVHNIMENALKRCTSLSRTEPFTITTSDFNKENSSPQNSDTDYISYYNDISPKFLKIVSASF